MSNTRHLKKDPEPKPTPLGKGRYAIYQTPEGDGVITYRPDGETKDNHQVIPKGIWSLVMRAIRGEEINVSPMDLMRMMMGK